MNVVRRVGVTIGDSLRIKLTDENLGNTSSGRVWSNQDMDPVAPERRNWSAWTFAGYWISESWAPNTWSVGSSMVAGGLLWWHALLACIVGHIIAACLTVWNGRGGAIYHIGFPIWMRATFGMWGSLFPLACRSVLALVWCGIQTWFGALFIDVSEKFLSLMLCLNNIQRRHPSDPSTNLACWALKQFPSVILRTKLMFITGCLLCHVRCALDQHPQWTASECGHHNEIHDGISSLISCQSHHRILQAPSDEGVDQTQSHHYALCYDRTFHLGHGPLRRPWNARTQQCA
jgi:hypothetical protein